MKLALSRKCTVLWTITWHKYETICKNNKRVGAGVAHRAHNPRVGRSKLPLARKQVFLLLIPTEGTLGLVGD